MVVLASAHTSTQINAGDYENNLLLLLRVLCWGGAGLGGPCFHEIATWRNGPWRRSPNQALGSLHDLIAAVQDNLLACGVSEDVITQVKKNDWVPTGQLDEEAIPMHIAKKLGEFKRLCSSSPRR